jgi:hypothetical protein
MDTFPCHFLFKAGKVSAAQLCTQSGSISSFSRTKIPRKGQNRFAFYHERSTQQVREKEKPFVLGRE